MDRLPITREGLDALRRELDRLKHVERPANIQAIEEARAHGDLSENAEYHAAKERQGFIEGKIGELEFKVANADVIDPTNLPKDRLVFGHTVVLENVDTGEEVRYMLVGSEESDIKNGRISVGSPLGKALIGRKVGDEVQVQAPGGKRMYEIVEIE
ncbi:MAG: transcription elongation factor GreA [Desulfatibacillaceae bacterium]